MGFSGSYVSIIHRRPKARKAFSEMKNTGKYSFFKYGKKFGKGEFVVDTQRMEHAERDKNKRGFLVFISVLFFGLIISYSIFEFVIAPSLGEIKPSFSRAVYAWESHATIGTIREIQSMWVIEKGYTAWGDGDYEKAIWLFEHSEGAKNYWWRREFALIGVYGERCEIFNRDCIKYEAYRTILKDDSGAKVPEKYKEIYFRDIRKYNKEMIAYFEEKNE